MVSILEDALLGRFWKERYPVAEVLHVSSSGGRTGKDDAEVNESGKKRVGCSGSHLNHYVNKPFHT